MVMELTRTKTFTLAEFKAMPDDGGLYELIRGEISELAVPNPKHGVVVSNLARHIGNYLVENPLGQDFTMSNFNILPQENTSRVPDFAFISQDRLPDDIDDARDIIPDLAVEVISPSETVENIQQKVDEYQRAGVKLIWSIYIIGKYVLVRKLNEPRIVLLNLDDELDGENIIPGFKLKVSKLFEFKGS
jgi:Uma2 family endonuclease